MIDATGMPDPIRAAVDMVASAGRVTVVGMSGEEVPAAHRDVHREGGRHARRELLRARRSSRRPSASSRSNEALLEPLISRRFPLERAPEALAYAMEHPAEVMKVVITSDDVYLTNILTYRIVCFGRREMRTDLKWAN